MPVGSGNASKRVADPTIPPWIAEAEWGIDPDDGHVLTRGERAIKFITTYCIIPKGHGAGKPMQLAPFQRWLIVKWLDTPGLRSAMLSIPRGNGKSTLMAALALWALHDDTDMPQVPLIATTLKQVLKTIYKPAAAMNARSPELANRTIPYSGIGDTRLFVPWNEGELWPLASDYEALQGLDPTFAVVDEVGFVGPDEWDAMELASGKRPVSLVIGVGTPNVLAEGAMWDRRKLWRENVALPGFWFHEYAAREGCAITDRAEWYKANPALDAGFLAVDAIELAVNASREASFRVFRLGQWANAKDGWLPVGVFESHRVDGIELDPEGSALTVGIDMAIKHDTTAVIACQLQTYVTDEMDSEGVPIIGERIVSAEWLFEQNEGEIVDYVEVENMLRQIHLSYTVSAFGYDPAYFRRSAQDLEDEGLPMVEFGQGAGLMVPAAQVAFKNICMPHRFAHNFGLEATKQVIAAEAKPSGEAWRLTKGVRAKSKNDAAIALVMSLFLLLGSLVEPDVDPMSQMR